MDKKGRLTWLLPVIALGGALISGCASMGRPEGGPRDVTPPVYVSSSPRMSQTGVSPQRITINFDENIELQDAFSKVMVSPVQTQPPQVVANGRSLSVEFRDTLINDMTYTIDFGDAIKDLNEGNILDGFSFDFSTGPVIDTLRISGMVLEARTLEPAQGMLVGVHSLLADTAISTLPFDRVTRTNALGQFTVRNLKPGKYRVFALNDLNRDYKWDRSEDIAFLDTVIMPSVESITVTDTLMSSSGADSTATRPGLRYLPNDLLLTWFNENYTPLYLKNHERPSRERITLSLSASTDTLPSVRSLTSGLPSRAWSISEVSEARDSINYWLTDPQMLSSDSLRLEVTYQKPDSLNRLCWVTDTLDFNLRKARTKKKDSEPGDSGKSPSDSVKVLNFRPDALSSSSTMEIYNPLRFIADTPIDSINPSLVHLSIKVDTLWQPVPGALFRPDSLSPSPLRTRVMAIDWKPGAQYRIKLDTLAVSDIYGLRSKPVEHTFTVRNLEDYGHITLRVSALQPDLALDSLSMVIELLDGSDKPVRSETVKNSSVTFSNLAPGTYYARLFIDADQNGIYSTGNVASAIQPEFTFYYPKPLNLKKNWTIEQSWVIDELPLDMQKPLKIKKNLPDSKSSRKGDNSEEQDEEEELPFGVNPFDDRRNDRKNNRDIRNGGYNTSGGFGNIFGGNNTSLRR